MRKYILIICDGMGDLPIPELGHKTPLEAAVTPNMDRLAKGGRTGMMNILRKGIRPNSDEAHLSLFGYNLKKDYPGRGPIEAVGLGIELQEGDIAIRANLATVDNNLCVLDRRTGRIESTADFVKDLDGIKIDGIEFLVKPGTGYRVALVMRGKDLTDQISNSDVHYVTENKIIEHWEGLPVNVVRPLDDTPQAKFTADVLEKFLKKSHEILERNPLNAERKRRGEPKGNYLLTRGPSFYRKLKSFKEKWGLSSCCIAGGGLYKGLGVMFGMDLINVLGATGLPNTDVKAKIDCAKEMINKYDFIFIHIKPTDIFGENGDFKNKKKFIEKIDQAINFLDKTKAVIAITADHSTPCSKKDHSSDPVPFLIYKKNEVGDNIPKFGERFCVKGSLGEIEGKDFLKILFQI